MAADLAQHGGVPHQRLLGYAEKHMTRTLMPLAVMAFAGLGGSTEKLHIRESLRRVREVFIYLWKGPASADPVDAGVTYVRDQFAAMLRFDDPDFPQGALDPLIDYIADVLAQAVPDAGNQSGDRMHDSAATGA